MPLILSLVSYFGFQGSTSRKCWSCGVQAAKVAANGKT
ncbi:hypothetical protein SLEP1_g57563 [Rubroshorea leprosula]|uniref:Uncharacterized protein n=1 Tax=Rubroshorea leprosula TaxID=152421 RepID=A0AAV5MPX6_9ROSI|nr:hypothetical protein SLEP1_g57563 [Rubroshorea leprosula]